MMVAFPGFFAQKECGERKQMKCSFMLNIFLILLLSGCTHFFFQPSRKVFYSPEKLGYRHQEISFKSTDGTRLHGWYFQSTLKKAAKGTILQFHGNAENVSTHFLSLIWLIEHGYNLFIFDYRGYGKSRGRPDPGGINRDAIAAIRFCKNHFAGDYQKFIIWGQSIGGIIALRALIDPELNSSVDAAVIESSFLSYRELAREKLSDFWLTWAFQPLTFLLVSDSYSVKDAVIRLSPTPLLVIHGTDDRVVPFRFGEEIFSRAGEPREFLKIKGGVHLNSMTCEYGRYRSAVLKYFEKIGTRNEKK